VSKPPTKSDSLRDPLLGPCAAIALGVLSAHFVPFSLPQAGLLTAAFITLAAIAALRRVRVLAGICCGLGLLFTGIWTAVVHIPRPPPEIDAEAREIVILGGCVVEPPAVSGARERFVLELEPKSRAQVTLYTRAGESLPDLRYGQNIELDAKIRKPHNYGNPGAFDYVHYLAERDIYWTASGAAATLRVLPGHCGSPFQKFIMDLRAAALTRIARMYEGNAYRTAMVQAILIGQNYQLQRVWTEDYRNTGTFHTLVISGTHVAILAAFFLFLLRICFVPESAALFITAAVMWLYALVAGWGAPCVRSAAGLTLFSIARYFYRERRPLNLLAAVAIGFLLLDPDQLFDASFQLTFLAVAFLGAFAKPLIDATTGPLSRGLAGLGDTGRDIHISPRVAAFRVEMRLLALTLHMALRLPRRATAWMVAIPARLVFFFFEVAAVSAVAQVGLALPMIVYFHRVGLSGLSANAFIVPILGVAVPIAFVAVFTGWIWVAKIAGWLLGISRLVVAWHAGIEPHWRVPPPPLWLGVAFGLSLIAFAFAAGRVSRIASGSALGIALTLMLWHPFPPQFRRGELEMTAIDVGQGDSILVVFPDGKTMLMDGGGIPGFGGGERPKIDTGEDVVAPYLWERSFRSIDIVALSHAHEDHIGGLPAILDDFHPRELWTGATPESAMPAASSWRNLRSKAEKTGVKIVPMLAGRKFPLGGAEIEILAPMSDYIPSDEPKNNDSLVMRIRYGARTFLLCGDAERPIERRMLADGEIAHADVLKVGHHGSHTSSTPEFLDAASPEFAVVSAGYANSYGHPNRDVVERLIDRRAAVYRTDEDGLITIHTDGKRLAAETGPGAPWGFTLPLAVF
jgi:competence protein ComEC